MQRDSLTAQRSIARGLRYANYVSLCLSVRLSHAGIVSKRLNQS